MQDENSQSSSTNRIRVSNSEVADDFVVNGDDLGKLVGDNSFSDVTSDDSSGWMHKIDVTNFQRLTSTSSSDPIQNNLQELAAAPIPFLLETHPDHPQTLLNSNIKMEDDGQEEVEEEDVEEKVIHNFPNFNFGSATVTATATGILAKNQFDVTRSSLDYDSQSRQLLNSKLLSPPMKKSRHREHPKLPIDQQQLQQQISVVTSSSDSSRQNNSNQRQFPKPVYSYSCMIALALKNSQLGRLQVAEIYCFMCENFPYFRTAPAGWKNSVRHNLSLNKCFEKIEVEAPGGHGRKCCLWTLNPLKVTKMDQEIKKYREKDPNGVREAYARPDDVDIVEQGLKGMPSKATVYHPCPLGRTALPDVVQQVNVEFQHQHHPSQAPHFGGVDTTTRSHGAFESGAQCGYVGVGRSELALKLLQQAAGYGQAQWSLHLPTSQPSREIPATVWPPSQLENNRGRFTPTLDQCPLEFSPIHHQGQRPLSSPPPYSTPIRRSSVAACYSPFSHSQPDPQHHHRPSSLNQFPNSDLPPSICRQPNSPLLFDTRPLPVFRQLRTPERPASCGYFFGGDSMIGGNNNSILVTPTNESQRQRGSAFGTSLEAAFCAATAHNNSLIMQSMQQQQMQRDQQQEVYPMAFQSTASPLDNGALHLTSL